MPQRAVGFYAHFAEVILFDSRYNISCQIIGEFFCKEFSLNSLGTLTHFSLYGTIIFSSPLWRKINKRFLKGVWGKLFSKRVFPN